MIKRLRIFAGPNGSGKTTLIRSLQGRFSFGCYLNADDLLDVLSSEDCLPFDFLGMEINIEELKGFAAASTFLSSAKAPFIEGRVTAANQCLTIQAGKVV